MNRNTNKEKNGEVDKTTQGRNEIRSNNNIGYPPVPLPPLPPPPPPPHPIFPAQPPLFCDYNNINNNYHYPQPLMYNYNANVYNGFHQLMKYPHFNGYYPNYNHYHPYQQPIYPPNNGNEPSPPPPV